MDQLTFFWSIVSKKGQNIVVILFPSAVLSLYQKEKQPNTSLSYHFYLCTVFVPTDPRSLGQKCTVLAGSLISVKNNVSRCFTVSIIY